MFSLYAAICLLAIAEASHVVNFKNMHSGRSKRDISLAVSGVCVVTGDQLFANGFEVRELTSDEQNSMQQYLSERQQFDETRSALRKQLQNATRHRFRGQDLTTDQRQALDQLRNMTAPQTPSFCDGNDTVLYIFEGCMVQNNKVYIGNTYARDLSSSEQQSLETFLQQVSDYMQYKESQFNNKMSSFASKMNNMFSGDNDYDAQSDGAPSTTPSTDVLNTSTSSSTAPEFPETPKFCYSF